MSPPRSARSLSESAVRWWETPSAVVTWMHCALAPPRSLRWLTDPADPHEAADPHDQPRRRDPGRDDGQPSDGYAAPARRHLVHDDGGRRVQRTAWPRRAG